MKRRAWLALLICLLAPLAAARNDPDLNRLTAQLAQLESNPVLGQLAEGERMRAHQALIDLKEAYSWHRLHLLYLAERRVAAAEFAAEAEFGSRQLEQLRREHDRILLVASRRDAERARIQAEHLQLQNQASEELAQRAAAEHQAQEQLAAGIAEKESEQARLLAVARAREDELAQQETALRNASPPPAANIAIHHNPRGSSMLLPDAAFVSGKGVLRTESRAQLQAIVDFVQASPASKVRIEGHADSRGKPQANLLISQQRADAVRHALIAAGVAAARIQAVGLGAEQPIAKNTTAAGRASNRRVEVIVLAAR